MAVKQPPLPAVNETVTSKKIAGGPAPSCFRGFLSRHRSLILIVMVLALAVRLALVTGFPRAAGDETRYRVPTINMLAGRGFSSDVVEPIRPSDHTVPLYSVFIAGLFAVFGQHDSVIRIAQTAIDLMTCVLVAFVAFSLAPVSLREWAAICGLVIYGLLCWFTLSWTRYILTETLATFLTMLAVAVSIMNFRSELRRWLMVGLICGFALLTRADSLLLVSAFGLFLIMQIARQRTPKSVLSLLSFCLVIPVVLAPWIIRNYVTLGKFQPLASAVGMPHGEYVPPGYLAWIRTWMSDQTHYKVYHPVLFPGSRSFDPHELPEDAFDSAEEKAQVFSLIDQYNRAGRFTADMNEQFQTIANNRVKRAPLRFFVWLPVQRMAGMWLTGFATTNRLHRLLRILSVLPIIIGGIVGLAFLAANRRLVELLTLIVVLRTLFFGFLNSDEHYIVEAYPAMIAACGVSAAALGSYVNRAWTSRAKVSG